MLVKHCGFNEIWDLSDMAQHIKDFIIDGADWFCARLYNGWIRVGNVGGIIFDLPPRHSGYSRAVSAKTGADVEMLVDELVSRNLSNKGVK